MRTLCKRYGGKSYLADWIVSNFPPRDQWHLYREPYVGGGAVIFENNPDGISETVNDIDGNLTALWDCIRDANLFVEFSRRVNLTPFSDVEFDRAGIVLQSAYATVIDRAVAFFVRSRQSRQGIGRDFATPTQRLRRRMHENVSAWLSAVDGLPDLHSRIRQIEVRNMHACDFIKMYDHPMAFFYCDPPYLHQTRTTSQTYEFEMTYRQHCDLLNMLSGIKGKFMLSGYRSSLYDGNATAYGWRRIERAIDNKASSKKIKDVKIECLYMNYSAA